MTAAKSGPGFLGSRSGTLRTRMGAAFVGTRAVFRGHDLHNELHDLNWLALYIFGVTGRRLSAQTVQVVDAIWTYTSYPDARIWNNRVAALVGATRGTPALSISAALAVSDAKIYGGQSGVKAFDFLTRALTAEQAGMPLSEFVADELKLRRIYGYGRPINAADERIAHLMSKLNELGFESGPHMQCAFAIETLLVAYRAQLKMNYAGLYAAIFADLGFSMDEHKLLQMPMFMAGMAPCYLEALQNVEGSLLPVACADIAYDGVARRPWLAAKVRE